MPKTTSDGDREPVAFELQDDGGPDSEDLALAAMAAATEAGARLVAVRYADGMLRMSFDRPVPQESVVENLVRVRRVRAARGPVDRELPIVA